MVWRKVLKTDLGNALRGGKPAAVTDRWRGPRYVPMFVPGRFRWQQDLMLVTRQLGGFVGANVDLVRGLEALVSGAPKRRLKRLYRTLAHDLAGGESLAAAMRKRSRFFPRYYCDLVQAGEDAGTLESTFAELNDELGRKGAARATVTGWLAYVLVLLAIQVFVASFLLIRVFPVWSEMFGDFGYSLPGPARVLISLADTIHRGWPTGCMAIAALGIALAVVRRLLRARGRFDEIVGRLFTLIPPLRVLVVKRDLAHASLVLEKLLAAGVPLDRALEDAAALDLNPVYARLLTRLGKGVSAGTSLDEAMRRESRLLLPASFRALVSIGEHSGLLPEAFGRVGRFYQREVVKVRRVLARALMPLSLAVPAGVVLLVSLSWFVTYGSLVDILLDQM